jgi:hypothetical protein
VLTPKPWVRRDHAALLPQIVMSTAGAQWATRETVPCSTAPVATADVAEGSPGPSWYRVCAAAVMPAAAVQTPRLLNHMNAEGLLL